MYINKFKMFGKQLTVIRFILILLHTFIQLNEIWGNKLKSARLTITLGQSFVGLGQQSSISVGGVSEHAQLCIFVSVYGINMENKSLENISFLQDERLNERLHCRTKAVYSSSSPPFHRPNIYLDFHPASKLFPRRPSYSNNKTNTTSES